MYADMTVLARQTNSLSWGTHDRPIPQIHTALAETLGALEGYFVMSEVKESTARKGMQIILSADEKLQAQSTLITELVGALENAQKTLAMMVDDDAIKSTTVATAYAKCRESEFECRSILTKAKDQTNDR